MNIKRIFFVAALMCMVGLNYSCDKETTDSEELYSLDKDEIKEEDTWFFVGDDNSYRIVIASIYSWIDNP